MDMNDYYYFVKVVENKGFTHAAEMINSPKSKISRHIKKLEERLDIRLIQRTTRHFVVTEAGWEFYRHAKKVVNEVELAENIVKKRRGTLSGKVNISCSLGVSNHFMPSLISAFLKQYPDIEIRQQVSNDYVDIISKGLDMVIRGHEKNLPDSSLIQKHLAQVEWCLFASPAFLTQTMPILAPNDLQGIKALGFGWKNDSWTWNLTRYDGEKAEVPHLPIFSSDDMSALKTACIDGLGVVSLPGYVCKKEVDDGQLVRVLPQWHSRSAALSIIIPSRKGVLAEVRTFIDFLQINAQEIVNFSF
ncbi:MAG: LysR family transcriptional regulator [Alteromonadaceae bacterium]|uniref:LysR substrate-binding domain-containing protein n=1 Tax=Paraglaciecola chathamensis TaxID=368405 RepID=UPI000C60D95E|nr:LysR substrate-binding domain-containing protein [Paraglaciecola agarilytica]MBN26692.1 LysR family transcriptional regulator [Alteromonadaceae bacterium]|tara:strand:+ start:20108 stop:21016 length:909 start_codon:yes stop_codon:yes gene_type:complete